MRCPRLPTSCSLCAPPDSMQDRRAGLPRDASPSRTPRRGISRHWSAVRVHRCAPQPGGRPRPSCPGPSYAVCVLSPATLQITRPLTCSQTSRSPSAHRAAFPPLTCALSDDLLQNSSAAPTRGGGVPRLTTLSPSASPSACISVLSISVTWSACPFGYVVTLCSWPCLLPGSAKASVTDETPRPHGAPAACRQSDHLVQHVKTFAALEESFWIAGAPAA